MYGARLGESFTFSPCSCSLKSQVLFWFNLAYFLLYVYHFDVGMSSYHACLEYEPTKVDIVSYFSKYLDQNMSIKQVHEERKRQLKEISHCRGRESLTYAADLNLANSDSSIDYADLQCFHDQATSLPKDIAVDFILETPGGDGHVAEDMVNILHNRFTDVGIIVPGTAKSAGTIIAMSADEILMEPNLSSLGPIDAQLFQQGKSFSAQALLDGFESIKADCDKNQSLNRAYIPMLQSLSPGELEHAQNAVNFAKELVTSWLAKYKFRAWHTHATSGKTVTDQEKKSRASDIAKNLCDHGKWKSHGKSIKLTDLKSMGLKITDYSQDAKLYEAIRKYHDLLLMSFARSDIYKIFESSNSQIYKERKVQPVQSLVPSVPIAGVPMQQIEKTDPGRSTIAIQCDNCYRVTNLQANLGNWYPLKEGLTQFPENLSLSCPGCGKVMDLEPLKQNLEKQTQQPLIIHQET